MELSDALGGEATTTLNIHLQGVNETLRWLYFPLSAFEEIRIRTLVFSILQLFQQTGESHVVVVVLWQVTLEQERWLSGGRARRNLPPTNNPPFV